MISINIDPMGQTNKSLPTYSSDSYRDITQLDFLTQDYNEQFNMNHIHLPSTLNDEEAVDVHEFESQLSSAERFDMLSQTRRKKQEKGLTHPSRPKNVKEKVRVEDPNQEFTYSQNDESPSLMLSRSLRSSRMKTPLEKRRKKWRELKDVITTQKVNIIKDAFIDKLRRNNVYSQPVEFSLTKSGEEKCFLDSVGFQLKEMQEKVVSIILLVNILVSIFIYTLALVFEQFQHNPFIKSLEVISLCVFLMEIVVNLTTVRCSMGRRLSTFREIREGYKREGFYLDSINFVTAFVSLVAPYPAVMSLRLIALFKFSDVLQRLQKLQVYFIQNYYYEQYWSLVKVFLFNFCFAHVLSIILLEMANLNDNHNWMVTRGISNAEWFQRYIWAYYWGTTVMLTIGFGDIVPVTYQEACCMILVETLSCVILSYNISCVGALITNIRSQDIQRSKDLKIFKKLADKHHINDELTWKINSHIEEHVNIKKMFNIQEEMQFVERLPPAYRVDYTKQANKAVFQKLMFFSHMMEKTLISLAEKIEKRITHPQEIILAAQHHLDLFILKNGEVGFISRKNNRQYSQIIIDRLTLGPNDPPFLLNANFITKGKSPFGIKSIVYSVVYSLEYNSLINILRQSNLDFEMYCQLRDKSKHKLDEFQVFTCSNKCRTKHTKFICPKLHFMPLAEHVIDRYLAHQKIARNDRVSYTRKPQARDQNSCLMKYLQNSQIYQRKKNEQRMRTMHKNVKKERYVIDELKPVENGHLKHNQKEMAALEKMQLAFLENTTELIKNYTSKMAALEKGEDQIWEVQADRMKNYRHYFSSDNSCNLQQRFDVNIRLQNLKNQQQQLNESYHSKESKLQPQSPFKKKRTSLDGGVQIKGLRMEQQNERKK